MSSDPNEPAGTRDATASIAAEMRCTCAVLRRATRRMTQFYDDALKPAGLKLSQYSVLANLAQAEDPSITDLAERLMMDRTTLTRNLRPLERAGWVRLGRGGDARSRAVLLTESGRRTLEAARPVWRAAETAVRDRLGADGGQLLRRLLTAATDAVAGEKPGRDAGQC